MHILHADNTDTVVCSQFQTHEKLYLLVDYFNGGELFFHLRKVLLFSFFTIIENCVVVFFNSLLFMLPQCLFLHAPARSISRRPRALLRMRGCAGCGIPTPARSTSLRAASQLQPVCTAVVHTGVIYRDLKPENILLDKHGSPSVLQMRSLHAVLVFARLMCAFSHLRLTDFGLSKDHMKVACLSVCLSASLFGCSSAVVLGRVCAFL
jgi:serine/threonine protein kinase